MTDDTSQPPAPQPGWVATVTIKMVEPGEFYHAVEFPNGRGEEVHVECLSDAAWSPPPPPPWEPEIGELVYLAGTGAVVVHAIKGEWAWIEGGGGPQTARLCDLCPPKGGA
jgi:hypothetical protein